ncbi:MAG TPA: hypothetical protein VHJ82_10855 [Actinomycetota bacterium]|nr:hypothetical protein [Actinomycetota bacterium]
MGGITAYGFLALAARALGPERYAPLSSLWALTFNVAPGLFLPLEQQVGRHVAHGLAGGQGSRSTLHRAVVLGLGMLALLLAVLLLARPWLDVQIFDDYRILSFALGLSLCGYASEHLLKGIFLGTGRFAAYGVLVGSEGVARLAICAVLFVAGNDDPGAYGLAFAAGPVFASLLLAGKARVEHGASTASWTEMSAALFYLLAGSLCAQTLVNGGPLAVKLLATPAQSEQAGRFLVALVVARVPLFMFQAVQASLLSRLATLSGAGLRDDFVTVVTGLLRFVFALGMIAIAAAYFIGPTLVRAFFGAEFALSGAGLAVLAAAVVAFMGAIVLAQVLVALSGYVRLMLGWLLGVVVFVGACLLPGSVVPRVERAFLAGCLAACFGLLGFAWGALSRRDPSPGEAAAVALPEALDR